MNYTLSIDKSKYPKLNKTNEELQVIFTCLVDKWYNAEYMQTCNLSELDEKIQKGLEPVIHELFGISKGTKKGIAFENIMDKVLLSFPSYTYIKTSLINHCGDGILKMSNFDCLIEFKNYNNIVPTSQIDKLKDDMISNNIYYSMMISTNNIQNKRDIDIEIFTKYEKRYAIVYISNYFNNEMKINIGILLVEQIYSIKKNINYTFFTKQLDELYTIINDITKLRLNFIDLETIIKNNLDSFYIEMRELEATVKNKVKYLISNTNKFLDEAKNKDKMILDNYNNNILYHLYENVLENEMLYFTKENENLILYTFSNVKICTIIVNKNNIILNFIHPDYKMKVTKPDLFMSEILIKSIIQRYKVLKKM